MYLYFYFFFLPAALIESFNGDAESVSDVPPSTRHSASLSLPLILQPGISEPPQPLLPASAPSAPLPAPSLGTGSQQAAFGNPPALLQPPEVPVAHSTQFAANHQEFLPHLQAPQPIVPGLSVVAGALASAAAVASAMAAPPQPQSTTEPLPAMVQTLPLDANSVLTSNPTITITPTPSAAILQPSLVMGEQNLQWLLNGATSTPQAQEQIVSMRWKGTQWAKCMGGWRVQRPLRQKRKTAVISTPKHIILPAPWSSSVNPGMLWSIPIIEGQRNNFQIYLGISAVVWFCQLWQESPRTFSKAESSLGWGTDGTSSDGNRPQWPSQK